jgi:uncharacterized RDD family membrane protein YckC
MKKDQQVWISGFWRRIGALFIDGLLLGIIGFVLGIFFENVFVEIGAWGRLIGFLIALSYFGIMGSSLFNGQTFGKKLLKIQVVNSSNSTITLTKSFLRYSILLIPFFLNGAQINNEILLSYLLYLLSFIVFGGSLSTTYLYVFNRTTRQSLHDLIIGTYVVNINVAQENINKVWRPHIIIVFCLFTFSALIPVYTSSLSESKPFKGLLATQQAINKNPMIRIATIMEGSTTFTSSDNISSTTTYVTTQAFLYQNDTNNSELAQDLAKTIINTYPESKNKNLIQVILIYGYDIGIYTKWNSFSHTFNPNEIKTLDQSK